MLQGTISLILGIWETFGIFLVHSCFLLFGLV
jgi:hypothetical protein